MLKLSQIDKNEHVVIVNIEDKDLERRLINLGLVPGSEVVIYEKAPFGGLLALRMEGTILAIRNKSAQKVEVKRKDG